MAAPKGNQFWKARSSHGRKPIFPDPDKLWDACCEYFEWVEANPLWEDKLVTFQGAATHEPVAKMRAMTISGLCVFLDISQQAWSEYRQREGYGEVTTRVEDIIRDQKFAGAAADLLNPNIIARDLGLADKSELTGKDGGPIKTEDVSGYDLARRIAFALSGNDKSAG
ncbi:DNA-packaging protein [Brucella sp. IR073]|uniref:DNA-packaging protein n=1 Tax=unclassified Brucella TaxID=2632610 RepID=UPI003B984032